jgi:hypothetical protein
MVPKHRTAAPLVGLLLFLGTLALYYPALQNGFVNYDDPHLLDVQLFGLRPAGHHAQSVLWHAPT